MKIIKNAIEKIDTGYKHAFQRNTNRANMVKRCSSSLIISVLPLFS